jgi:pseudoazurin
MSRQIRLAGSQSWIKIEGNGNRNSRLPSSRYLDYSAGVHRANYRIRIRKCERQLTTVNPHRAFPHKERTRIGELTMRLRTVIRLFAVLGLAIAADNAAAQRLEVKGVVTQWRPLVLFAQPGDTVTFVGMIGHDSASIEGMIPAGAQSWKSKLGEEAFTITVEKKGVYIYKCTPHMSSGMVGSIVVGDGEPHNLASIEESLPDVKIGRNMVNRTLKKTKKALAARAGQ